MAFTLLPATNDDFVNRKKEISEILSVLKDKKSTIGFALYGKRRIGKTSIFKEAERRLKDEKHIVPVYFSLFDLTENTIYNLAKELAAAILEAYRARLSLKHKARDLIKLPFNILGNILKEIRISLEIKDIISLSLGFDKNRPPDLEKLIDDIFALPEKLAAETKTKCVLLIDEFPEIMNMKKNGSKIGAQIVGKIRTIIEDKKGISFNISGSIRKTMEQIAIAPNSAFYRQFILKLIEPLDKNSATALFRGNLRGRVIAKDADEALYSLTQGFPFYIQFIGRIIQQSASKKISSKTIKAAMENFLSQEGNIIFKEEFSSLSDNERNILLAMATSNFSSSAEIVASLSSNSSLVIKTLSYLIEKGLVEKKAKGRYVIDDPIFELWLRRQGI